MMMQAPGPFCSDAACRDVASGLHMRERWTIHTTLHPKQQACSMTMILSKNMQTQPLLGCQYDMQKCSKLWIGCWHELVQVCSCLCMSGPELICQELVCLHQRLNLALVCLPALGVRSPLLIQGPASISPIGLCLPPYMTRLHITC